MPVAITLDASELVPPEPFDRATEILAELAPGEYLRMLHRRQPFPLYDVCKAMSLDYHVVEGGAAPYEIIIYFPVDEAALRREGVL